MKALIIGGKGQLGTTLTQTAPEAIEYRSLDLPEIDITDADAIDSVVGDETPDVIINASAYTAVDRAEEEVDLAYAVNATGPGNIAMAARKAGARLIHVSTDYVFDGTACTPYPPEAPCSPLGVYGKSKRQGEINVLDAVDNAVIFQNLLALQPIRQQFRFDHAPVDERTGRTQGGGRPGRRPNLGLYIGSRHLDSCR